MTEVLALDGSRLFGQPKLVPVMKRSHKGRRSRHVNFAPSSHGIDSRASPPTATSTMDQTQRSTAGTDAPPSEKKKRSSDVAKKRSAGSSKTTDAVTFTEKSQNDNGEKNGVSSGVPVLVAERIDAIAAPSSSIAAWYALIGMMSLEILLTLEFVWKILSDNTISVGVHLIMVLFHVACLFVTYMVVVHQTKRCCILMAVFNFLYAFFTAIYILCSEGSKTNLEAENEKHRSSIRIAAVSCISFVCNLLVLAYFYIDRSQNGQYLTSTTCTCVVVAKPEPKESKKEKAKRILAGTSESIREKSIKKADLFKQKIKEMLNKKKKNADADTTSAVKTSASGRRFVSVSTPATPTTEDSGTVVVTPNMKYLYERA